MKLTSSIPIPAAGSSQHKYPFQSMKIGDSFFVALDDTGRIYRRIMAASSSYGLKHDMRFSLRMVDEDGKKGVRCWRIK